jgi:hypothetical protein
MAPSSPSSTDPEVAHPKPKATEEHLEYYEDKLATNGYSHNIAAIAISNGFKPADGRLVVDPAEAAIEYGEEIASKLKKTEDGTKILWPQRTLMFLSPFPRRRGSPFAFSSTPSLFSSTSAVFDLSPLSLSIYPIFCQHHPALLDVSSTPSTFPLSHPPVNSHRRPSRPSELVKPEEEHTAPRPHYGVLRSRLLLRTWYRRFVRLGCDVQHDDDGDQQSYFVRFPFLPLFLSLLFSLLFPSVIASPSVSLSSYIADKSSSSNSNWSIFCLGPGGIAAVFLIKRFGRLPVLFYSQLIGLGFLIGCAVAPNLKTFAAMRILNAFFSTAPCVLFSSFFSSTVLIFLRLYSQCVGLWTVCDLFPFHLQARKLNLWTMGFIISYVSPLISSFSLFPLHLPRSPLSSRSARDELELESKLTSSHS